MEKPYSIKNLIWILTFDHKAYAKANFTKERVIYTVYMDYYGNHLSRARDNKLNALIIYIKDWASWAYKKNKAKLWLWYSNNIFDLSGNGKVKPFKQRIKFYICKK